MSEEPSALHSDERRLAAILAADVAGYSRLMGRNEDETVRDLEAEGLPERASLHARSGSTSGSTPAALALFALTSRPRHVFGNPLGARPRRLGLSRCRHVD